MILAAHASEAPVAFFQTTATVIPVLFFAMVLQFRHFEQMVENAEQSVWERLTGAIVGLALLSFIVVGEIAALSGVIHPTAARKGAVEFALMFQGLVITMAAAQPIFKALFPVTERRRAVTAAAVIIFFGWYAALSYLALSTAFG